MNREIVLPAWLSVLSLAVALFVPLGVSLISDTSADAGNQQGIVHEGNGRFVPAKAQGSVPVEQGKISYFDHRA
ncbi:MAG: hypothetical protein WA056_09965 [Gallionella sp.]